MLRTARKRFFSLLALMLAVCMLAACGTIPAPEVPKTPAPTEPTPIVDETPEAPPEEPAAPEVPTIGGLAVDTLCVAYPAANAYSEGLFAQNIADAIAEIYNVNVPVIPDDAAAYVEGGKILVGDCSLTKPAKPEGMTVSDSCLVAGESAVLVSGGSSLGLYGAVNELVSRIRNAGGESLELADTEIFIPQHETTRVMSFNLLGSNKTMARTDRVKKIITNYMPDSFGVQEANFDWSISLLGYFTEVGAPYDCVGQFDRGGNNGNRGCLIFYRTDKYTVLDSGTKWLSDTPDLPSSFEGAQNMRNCTYAILQEIKTGKTYVHLNTHLDTVAYESTRNKQATVLLDIAEQFRDYPLIITGDFNSRPTTVPIQAMQAAGYVNSSETAPDSYGFETFHGYGTAAAGAVLDYCFLNPARMAAVNYRVCDEKIDGDYPSDHYPVIADFVYW